MNIFIDTSVIYSDPFWKENYSSQLLNVANEGRIKIYISEVVLKELRYNFEKNLDKSLFDLRRINSSLKSNLIKFKPIQLPDKNECLIDFDRYYNDLQKYNKVEILECKDEFLKPLLTKAISRKKPFSEKKTEFKDALIWMTYSDYINKNKLYDCILLTANCNDFCDIELLKQNKYELHPDLKKECDKFLVYITIKDFYKNYSDWLDKPKIEFKKWIENERINDEYVFNLLWEHEGGTISGEILSHIEKIEPSDLFEDPMLIIAGGYLISDKLEWYKCENIEIDIISDFAIISGIVVINTNIQGYGYNFDSDFGDDEYPFIDEKSVELNIHFNFLLKNNKIPENFEIIEIETI